ncbi:MAG TPA: tRNA pseudouridine(13) synthase TruD [Nitrospiraceae bacterium]|nr:tRNA pseudouridine(13) synthase TruD [Nitrospiraceae bacterium]
MIQTDKQIPFLTAAVGGIGGIVRYELEDFRVTERPLYLPCGQGEHFYLRITKRGLSTPDMVSHLASVFGVKAQCIGVAGFKDARAVTTQMVSVQGVPPDTIARLQPNDAILAVEMLGRHRNRLRTGHHAGNHFALIVRHVNAAAAASVPAILELLLSRGVPNYFGPQRQGRDGLNHEKGAALLRDVKRRGRMPRQQRLWFLHAYQSFLFNQILAARIERIDRVLAGDWAMKHVNGACFHVESAEIEQGRVDRFEISPTGPLFGSRAPWASGEPGELERAVVAEVGETPESLSQAAAACGFRGERRPLRVRLEDLEWSLRGSTLTLSFSLPPGAYATSVLRELMKSET